MPDGQSYGPTADGFNSRDSDPQVRAQSVDVNVIHS
jgi:hypothetical protein